MSRTQVDNPTSQDKGAGAGPNFQGGSQAARSLKQTSAVKEGSSGIIETTHIDPLNDNPNKGQITPLCFIDIC